MVTQQIYESDNVVNDYIKSIKLDLVENTILEIIKSKTQKYSMLDIGVGTGRTTRYFAPLFQNYIAIDFSAKMIEECKSTYKYLANSVFLHADVTALPKLSIDTFDFVFFSFNGIDTLASIEDRISVINNAFNLVNDAGLFVFSTHSTNALNRLYSFQLPRNPFKIYGEINRYRKLRKVNGPRQIFENKSFFQVYDGGEYFQLLVSYILPSYQYKIIQNAGFSKIIPYDISGRIIDSKNIDLCYDNWIHFACYK